MRRADDVCVSRSRRQKPESEKETPGPFGPETDPGPAQRANGQFTTGILG